MALSRLLLSLLIVSNIAVAKIPQTLHATVMLCANCHGNNGISQSPIYPNLAGQKELYLKQQLLHFRDGRRPSAVMEPIAKVLSDADIESLAAYYANLNKKAPAE